MTESELREGGLQWDNVQKCFLWNELSKDFIRELVEHDTTYKTQLEHNLLCAFHGYASYPSYFYKNMWQYIKLGLAEQKELQYYTERVGMLYMDQKQQEERSRHVYSLIDNRGCVLKQVLF